uniref:Uncharacterized protein n=1 Tax=Entomoneis paludosa TaxID=265537 RepID=A0A7S2YHU8_9STRA|mmetsp:Transcript_33683/g.70037  ORF Transcript_33683/g.70037 Transcript_33683/m.70037 type:complete len:170 (+) Transcript_33683:102-611(+)
MASRVDRVNAGLAKFCPELAGSKYARYPMQGDRWMLPKDKHPETGKYLFLASPQNVGPKPDHVYGKGPFGVGYYHLLCKQPYIILYGRHMNTAPSTCCTGASGAKEFDEWDEIRLILFQRMNSTRANDTVAHSDMMQNASATAQAHYHFGQNQQLITHATRGAVNFPGV